MKPLLKTFKLHHDEMGHCTRCIRYEFYPNGGLKETTDRRYVFGRHTRTLRTRYDDSGTRNLLLDTEICLDGTELIFKDLWPQKNAAELPRAPFCR